MTLFEDPEPAQPSGPVVRVRLLVAYLGAGFHGVQVQRGARTVAGELTTAAERVLQTPVHLTCAGRTDAGVHAWGQVFTFDVPAEVTEGTDVGDLARKLTRMLAPEIVVRASAVADDDFDARHSAKARRYRYTVLNRPLPDPFLAATAWWVSSPLDLRAMQLASDPLLGEHDFASFCRKPEQEGGSLVRTVLEAGWEDLGDGVLRFEIVATAFCQQMVRSIVGTLVEVGHGRKKAGEMLTILAAKDRHKAGPVAPPQGLCLWEVQY